MSGHAADTRERSQSAIGTIDGRRSCPACFRLKEIPVPMPVCRRCIYTVAPKLQSAYCTAILAGNQKDIIRLAGEIVTAAWAANVELEPMIAAVERHARGAR